MITAPTRPRLTQSAAIRLYQRYLAWRREAAAVQLAYERWASSDRDTRRLAYAGYLAALDQEALAAAGYRDDLARAGRVSRRVQP